MNFVKLSSTFVLVATLTSVFDVCHAEEVYFEDTSGQPQGGIILRYPDAAEARMRIIAENLSYHGWATLLVPLSTRDVGTTPLNNTSELIDVMASVRGQRNLVLLTVGNAWDDSIDVATLELGSTPIQGLILVDVPGDLNLTTDFPTLDIATTLPPVPGHSQRKQRARKERVSTNQSLSLTYSTRSSPRQSQGKTEDPLTKRIRGWLHQNLRGMEITELEP